MSLAILRHPDIIHAAQTSWSCPDQWHGQLADGRAFYFRYRHGVATLATGRTRADVEGVTRAGQRDGVKVAYTMYGDALDGSFRTDTERADVFRYLLAELDGPPADPESRRVALTGGMRVVLTLDPATPTVMGVQVFRMDGVPITNVTHFPRGWMDKTETISVSLDVLE